MKTFSNSVIPSCTYLESIRKRKRVYDKKYLSTDPKLIIIMRITGSIQSSITTSKTFPISMRFSTKRFVSTRQFPNFSTARRHPTRFWARKSTYQQTRTLDGQLSVHTVALFHGGKMQMNSGQRDGVKTRLRFI